MPDHAKVFLRLYWVLTGLVWLAIFLGFPTDVASPILIWISAALIFAFVFFVQSPRGNRVFLSIVGLMFVGCGLSSSPFMQGVWLIFILFLLLFRLAPFWDELCKMCAELFDRERKMV